ASAALSVTSRTATWRGASGSDLCSASDSGSSGTDNITSVTAPTFSGTAEANSTVTLFDGTAEIGSVAADGSGNWSITSSTLTDEIGRATGRERDEAGDESAASDTLWVNI